MFWMLLATLSTIVVATAILVVSSWKLKADRVRRRSRVNSLESALCELQRVLSEDLRVAISDIQAGNSLRSDLGYDVDYYGARDEFEDAIDLISSEFLIGRYLLEECKTVDDVARVIYECVACKA